MQRCMLFTLGFLFATTTAYHAAPAATVPGSSAWPQAYTVQRDDAAGVLSLRTPYYTIEHDLKQGGALRRIALAHGRASNLLVRPVSARVQDEHGAVWSDLNDAAPRVTHRSSGLNEVVTVESELREAPGRPSGLRLKTTFEYRWGYVKIRRQFQWPAAGGRVRELSPLTTVLAAELTDYGYREGISEAEGAPPFSFGSNRWGKLRPSRPSDRPLHTRYVPRSMLFADPGVEGLEWFVGSDLSAWERLPGGRRGGGRCSLELSATPPGLAWSIAPYASTNEAIVLTNDCVFDFYLAVPLLEGHAQRPWIHTSFNRNRGNWVAPETIRAWAEQGYQTVHCHNDGDYYDDGLFWRDGAYPPYPDMERFDQVLRECRQAGIRTATYFSNKELHPSTREFQEHGTEWGRMNRRGDLQHNFFRGTNEFGVQMCLRSGWLDALKASIDRVLRNHPLDGVYYDWNVALFCCNPRHEGTNAAAQGHWDIDELLDLTEWTRQRVGPRGLVILHNTTTPLYAAENFADHIVATEWGYQKWTTRAPALQDLPLEWSLAGARSRGVISYGTIDSSAPRRLHTVFALGALLGGVAPWPASPELFALLPVLKPIGTLESCRFADWRNPAVVLSDAGCASAIYSRPKEAFLLVANLEEPAKEITCTLRPDQLPYPLPRPGEARVSASVPAGTPLPAAPLDLSALLGSGLKLHVPGDGAVLIRVR